MAGVREAKKKHRQDAIIAFWYGINPKEIDDRTKAGLMANLPTVKAQQTLHLGKFDPADYETVHALHLEAFDSEHVASDARARAMELYVERRCSNGQQPDR